MIWASDRLDALAEVPSALVLSPVAEALVLEDDEVGGGRPGGGPPGPAPCRPSLSLEFDEMLLSSFVRSDTMSDVVTLELDVELAEAVAAVLAVPVSMVDPVLVEEPVDCRLVRYDCMSLTSFVAAASVDDEPLSEDDWSLELLALLGGGPGGGGAPDGAELPVLELLWSVLLD